MELANLTEHKQGKIVHACRNLGAHDIAEVNSENRHLARSFLNGLGIPSHLYESATLQELQEAYYSCSTNYEGIRDIIKKAFPCNDSGYNDEALIEIQNLTREAATRAYNNTIYREMCHSPAVILSASGATEAKPAAKAWDEFKQGISEANRLQAKINEKLRQQSTSEGTQTMPQTATQAIPRPPLWKDLPTEDTASNPAIPAQKPELGLSEQDATKHLLAALNHLMAINQGGEKTGKLDEDRVIALIDQHSKALSTKIEIVHNGEKRTLPELHHYQLPLILKAVAAKTNVMMVGGAGSGKTTIANQIAKALNQKFYFNGALSSEYKLTGFMDANGKLVRTPFREAYEHGGVYLFDEIDASMPDALLAFNAALANGHADFPDGTIDKHADFHCLAAANTYGKGADRVYVGRAQLDGASLDRFVVIDLEYDEKLERALASNDDWTDHVLTIRRAVEKSKTRHIVSPRASIEGAKLLAAGLMKKQVEESVIWKGLDKDSRSKVMAAV